MIAHILADPSDHSGKIYKLYGRTEMNHYEIAGIMSEVLGTTISYTPISIEEFRQQMEEVYKFGPFLVQHLVQVA